MPKIHRHRGVTTEVPIPTDPDIAAVKPADLVEPIVVDEHGDDAAAVDAAPAPATRKRSR